LVDAKGLTADQLRELARIIETAVPTVDSRLEAKYRELQDQLEGIQTSRSHRPLIAGLAVAGVLGGVGLGALWNPWIGAVLVLSASPRSSGWCFGPERQAAPAWLRPFVNWKRKFSRSVARRKMRKRR
jgi:hypothetical protein